MAAAETQKPAMDMAMPARQARGKQALESNMPILSDDEVMLVSCPGLVFGENIKCRLGDLWEGQWLRQARVGRRRRSWGSGRRIFSTAGPHPACRTTTSTACSSRSSAPPSRARIHSERILPGRAAQLRSSAPGAGDGPPPRKGSAVGGSWRTVWHVRGAVCRV